MDGIYYEDFAEKYQIAKYIVQMDTAYGAGTGFLYTQKGSSCIYIITVCHVVLKSIVKKERICIRYQNHEKVYVAEQFQICTLYDESELTEELCQRLEDEERSERHKDLIVLRMLKQEFADGNVQLPNKLYRLSEKKIKRNMMFAGYGYPDETRFYEMLQGICLGWDEEERMITCKAGNIHAERFEDAMRGFSGTGLIAEYEGSPVFIGVVVCCRKEELHHQFRIAGSTEIAQKLNRMGWDIWEEYDDEKSPSGFYCDEMMDLQDMYLEVMDDAAKQILGDMIQKIGKKCFPFQMSAVEKFYDIPICDSNRKKCRYYWCGRVWPMVLAMLLHENLSDTYYLSKDGKKLQIEYICSEGAGKAEIASVVGAAANYSILGDQISGDRILIWQSRENPFLLRIYQRSKFKNIIKNIANGSNKKYGNTARAIAYDLLDGELKEKDYGIVHVQYLMEKLADCQTLLDMRKTLEELLDEIWR